MKNLLTLLPYLKERSRRYLFGGIFLLLTNGFALGIPWLMKLGIDALRSGERRAPFIYGGAIVLTALLHGGVRIFSRTMLLHGAREIEARIREDLYAKLVTLDIGKLSEGRTGDVLSRFSNDLTNIRMLVGFGGMNVLNTLVMYTAAVILLGRISPALTLMALAPFPVMIVIVQQVTRKLFKESLQVQEDLAALTTKVEENVSASLIMRAYCREEQEIASFGAVNERYARSNLRMAKLRGALLPVMAVSGGLATLIVLFAGGAMVIDRRITLGDFVAFNGYLGMLIWPTVMMGWILNLIQRGAASMERINALLRSVPAIRTPETPVSSGKPPAGIEVRNLTFGHGSGEILRNVSFVVPAGYRVGIAGPVGSGKSTLAKLIPRLLDTPEGSIFIGGADVTKLPLEELRRMIGFAPQEGFLFSRSIRENILYGNSAAGAAAIDRAVEAASLERDLEHLPSGLDTVVGERGITLSGGQRQRVCIARALVKNPPILILDDPLSAVDAGTEERILAGLSRESAGKTLLLITHRLFPLRDFDLILLMEEGTVVERGRHEDLMAAGGRYAAMWREQQLRREMEVL